MTRKISIPNLQDFLKRYIAGESENALAKEIGVNRSTFRKRLIDNGITPRNQSQSEAAKWARMSDTQRANQVRAAHKAARGRSVPFDELVRRAKMREGNIHYNVSTEEIILADYLREQGIESICNFAVGPYNCDLGIGPITVEVWGGSWHPKPIDIKRTKYILDAGFGVLIVDTDQRRYPLNCRAVSNYIVSMLEHSSMFPATGCEYWMVRGDGEFIFSRVNNNDISLIPPFTTRRNPTNGQYERVPR